MRSKPTIVERLMVEHTAVVLQLAGLVAVCSGLVGGCVWLVDLADRSDDDSLRWGFWHNPFMQFPPFNEPFLDASMWTLLACSAVAGIGGLNLLTPNRWGARLVIWQARVSVVVNFVIAVLIVAMKFVFAKHQRDEWHLGGTTEALLLRLGSVAIDLSLWTLLNNNAVTDFFVRQSLARVPRRGFEVILGNHAE